MAAMQVNDQDMEWIGKEWIRALVEMKFQHIGDICQPGVRSRLMTPNHIYELENSSDLIRQVEDWFEDCAAFEQEQSRLAAVGERLGIFYRLSFEENGQPKKIEQQIYCSFREGLIDRLSLICSGTGQVRAKIETPAARSVNSAPIVGQPNEQTALHADAFLKFEITGSQGSACALLTPSIKHKLGEMNSGQVLEVQVDDPVAKADIESWSRLSGNKLLKVDQGEGPELRFYLLKK